jgi:hypothetical protein
LLRLNYTIEYKKSVENKVVDVLSRKEGHSKIMRIFELISKWVDDIKESYEGDKWIEEVKKRIEEGKG